MPVTVQTTEQTSKPLIGKGLVRLVYVTGTLPTTSTVVFDGEIFLTGLWIHGELEGKITIEEANQSSAMFRNLVLKKESPIVVAGSVGDLNSRKFYSGLRVWAEKENVHCQIRGFQRVITQPVNVGSPGIAPQ